MAHSKPRLSKPINRLSGPLRPDDVCTKIITTNQSVSAWKNADLFMEDVSA
jgi:hypothetical protein